MNQQQDDMILIKKTELVEFIQSIGMQFEEQRAMNTGQHTIEISGYQDRGEVFLIDYAPHSSQQFDVKELFRKEIAKWKDEDPLFMAYVYGQEAGAKDEREKVLWCEDADLSVLREVLNECRPDLELGDVWCDIPIRTRFEAKMMDFAGKKVRVTITELRSSKEGEP